MDPSVLILDLSPHLSNLRKKLLEIMISLDPVDLHGLRENAIENEMNYHVDTLFALVQKEEDAIIKLAAYKGHVHNVKLAREIDALSSKLYLELTELDAYQNGVFPYLYQAIFDQDCVILSRLKQENIPLAFLV
jgi:hypothetical protein